MSEPGRVPGSWSARLAVWLLIAAAFTAAMIQWSFRHGRLALPATYDDVGYFVDGAHRLDLFYRSGADAVVREWVRVPPHSPFSTGLAMVGFGLLGFHDWAPYAMNVLVVLALLLYVDLAASPAPLAIRAALAAFALTLPAAGGCAAEFHPDEMSAVLTAAGVVGTLTWRLGPRRAAAAGALFGAAALVKPSIAFLTFALMALAVGFRAVGEAGPGRWIPPRGTLRPLAFLVGSACLVAAPHFVLAGSYYFRYFHTAIFDRAKPIPPLGGGLGLHLRYFIDGFGGQVMLGRALPIVAAAALLTFLDVGEPRRRWGTLGLLAVTMAAWAVPTASPVKQQFFGLPFDFLLLGLAIRGLVGLGWALDRRPTLPTPLAVAAVMVAAGIAVIRMDPPRFRDGIAASDPVAVDRRHFAEEIYQVVAAGHQAKRVLVTFINWSCPGTTQYMLIARGRRDIELINRGYTDDLRQIEADVGRADMVLAAEPNTADIVPTVLSTPIQPQILARLRSHPDFTCTQRVSTRTGGSAFVFSRQAAFSGWEAVHGLLPREGPFPQFERPYVHWATGPSTMLELYAPRPGPYKLVLVGRPAGAGQSMELLVDGRALGRENLGQAWHVRRMRTDLELDRGPHRLEMNFASWDTDAAGVRRAVLFSEIRFEWGGPDPCDQSRLDAAEPVKKIP